MSTSFELKTVSSLAELTRITDFVLGSVRESKLADRDMYHLVMAVDEACTNIIKYSGSGEIRVKCEVGDEQVVVEIRDDGVAFNPLRSPAPNLDLPLEERVAGGSWDILHQNSDGRGEIREARWKEHSYDDLQEPTK